MDLITAENSTLAAYVSGDTDDVIYILSLQITSDSQGYDDTI